MSKILSFNFFSLVLLCCIASTKQDGETRSLKLYNIEGTSMYYLDIETAKDHNVNNEKYFTCYACPAELPKEVKFNREMSRFKNSLFIKTISSGINYEEKYICHGSFQPSIIYDRYKQETSSKYESSTYEIGYEVYSELEVVHDVAAETTALLSNRNHHYSGALIWVPIIRIRPAPATIFIPLQIEILYYAISKTIQSNEKCANFKLGEEFHGYEAENSYYKLNQDSMFWELKMPPKMLTFEKISDENEKNRLNDRIEYGYLVQQQLVPRQYFHSFELQLATCSCINTIPMWQSIAEGWWRKVEQYVLLVNKYLNDIRVITGTADVVTFSDRTAEYNPKKVFLNYKAKKIPVPRLVYKIIEYKLQLSDEIRYYAIAIITHNDPTVFGLANQVCETSICQYNGWFIFNDKSETGHTYCCPLNDTVRRILGVIYDIEIYQVLNLKAVPLIEDGNEKYQDFSTNIANEVNNSAASENDIE